LWLCQSRALIPALSHADSIRNALAFVADWPLTSVHAQLGQTYGVIMTEPVRIRYPDFVSLLAAGEEDERVMRLREAETIAGRLVRPSSISWSVRRDAPLRRGKPGPRPKISALSP